MERQIYESMGLSEAEFEKIVAILGREPNYTEVGLFAVMWSEHCGYKHSRAQFAKFPKKDLGADENAGYVEVDDLAVVFKVESHNHPSAVEPYHGAATGVGGVLRDIFTMGARPVAVLNSLRFGNLDQPHTQHLFREVVRGMADYGNIVGVPTVGGEVYFHDSFKDNPLVNAMAVGVAPKTKLATSKANGVGLTVLVAGAKTGAEGIHGATFASVELGEGEKKPSKTQEGNPEMERRLIEACLEVIAKDLVIAMQDMGAAGFTSSSCEMAAKGNVGMELILDEVPLKSEGLTPYEIMLSESQERMLLVILPKKLQEVEAVFKKHNVPLAFAGKTTADGLLRVKLHGEVYAEVPAKALASAPLLHPEGKRPAYLDKVQEDLEVDEPKDYQAVILELLQHPDFSSREWIYKQFDSNSRGQILIGSGGDGAVISIEGSKKLLAFSIDCNSRYCYLDPEKGSQMAVAEAARNVASTGAKPLGVTDGLCFGNPEDPEVFYTFAKSIDGIAKACLELDIPVVSGNVSFYNESQKKPIYPTPVIGVVGVIESGNYTTIAPQKDNILVLLGNDESNSLNASSYLQIIEGQVKGKVFEINWEEEKALQKVLLSLNAAKLITAAHDVADGGLAIALSEMALAANMGLTINLSAAKPHLALFGEKPSRAIVALERAAYYAFKEIAEAEGVLVTVLGEVKGESLRIENQGHTLCDLGLAELRKASLNLSQIMEG